MQAVVLCGRSIARAVLAGINNENVQNKLAWKNAQSTRTEKGLHLISASSGLSKIHSCAQVITKWSFGDDACFVAGHPKADVLGKLLSLSPCSPQSLCSVPRRYGAKFRCPENSSGVLKAAAECDEQL